MARRDDSQLSRDTLFGIGGFIAGALLVGVFALFFNGGASTSVHALRESDLTSADKYQFIDPLIGLTSDQQDSPQYATLKSAVVNFAVARQKSGVSSLSVYFRDIHMGAGFTYNPDTLYSPASLYKVPVMLAYYKLAEENPSVLQEAISYSGAQNEDVGSNVPPPVELAPGTYTVEELIEHMIKYSDNNAVVLLTNHLADTGRNDALTSALGDLGAPYGMSSDFLKIGSYAIFFRALYNATYLTPDYSEQALSLLSQTTFTDGIDNGVPDSVTVAHKFGDSNMRAQDGSEIGKELHDCGIVYYPQHPYVLCVMTKGDSIAHLEQAITGVSQLVYQDMASRYSGH